MHMMIDLDFLRQCEGLGYSLKAVINILLIAGATNTDPREVLTKVGQNQEYIDMVEGK